MTEPFRLEMKKIHMLRCAQSPRSNVPNQYASARRFFARLASEIFLSSLQTEFFSNLLVLRSLHHWNRRSMNYRILTLPNVLSAC